MVVEYLDGTTIVFCDKCGAWMASYNEPVVWLPPDQRCYCKDCNSEMIDALKLYAQKIIVDTPNRCVL